MMVMIPQQSRGLSRDDHILPITWEDIGLEHVAGDLGNRRF